MSVVIETTIGDFTVDLFTEARPQTCRNFLKLCKIKYYNFSLFYMVQPKFIAQTGDPTATGKGGESVYGLILGNEARYYEAEKMPKIKHDKVGLLSMVNCGDNMLGSQFIITLGDELQSLDGQHCVFGEIVEGLEVILKFNEAICDEDHRPYQDIRITHTVILDDPYNDPRGLEIPDRSPEPTKEVLMSDRIGADEVIDDTMGMSMEEIIEMRKAKEAKARATILEIVGDIPDADIAPPENVLFVCKLNPVTSDDDLEIIFSRFGKIVGCEVIRDRQTGDSLQYAFIEFAERKSCEDAYFKMDNVLIDDRRIHVDFSQSVSKMQWRGKGKGIKYFDDQNDKSNTKSSNEKNHQAYNEKNHQAYNEKNHKTYNEKNYKTYNDKRSRHEMHHNRSRSPKYEKNESRYNDRQKRRRSKSFSPELEKNSQRISKEDRSKYRRRSITPVKNKKSKRSDSHDNQKHKSRKISKTKESSSESSTTESSSSDEEEKSKKCKKKKESKKKHKKDSKNKKKRKSSSDSSSDYEKRKKSKHEKYESNTREQNNKKHKHQEKSKDRYYSSKYSYEKHSRKDR